MTKFLACIFNTTRNSNAVVLDAVASTHGAPGYLTPDRIVISRFGVR